MKVCLLFHSADTFVTQPPVKLVGGPTTYEGRVEVYLQGQWSTVCDDFWDSRDASVVCRQLGLSPNGAVALTDAYYGQGTGPILLDNVMCTGEELYLTSCPNNGLYVHDCVHAEDAGVRCQGEGEEGGKREGRKEGGEERGRGGKREGRKEGGRRWEEGGEEVGRGREGKRKREQRDVRELEGIGQKKCLWCVHYGASVMTWGCASAFQEMFRGVYGFCILFQYI